MYQLTVALTNQPACQKATAGVKFALAAPKGEMPGKDEWGVEQERWLSQGDSGVRAGSLAEGRQQISGCDNLHRGL